MDYEAFRTAVYSLLAERKEWKVEKDWEDGTSPGSEGPGSGADGLDEFIELEQENGPFYELITVSVGQLYQVFVGEGWNAVRRELDKYTRRENPGARRTRAVDYEERLNEEGVLLYRELRALRAASAAKRGLPPSFVFMNRSLYAMCCRQPSTMEELRGIYGVGEKNAGLYGEEFLAAIRTFTGGEKKILDKFPGEESLEGDSVPAGRLHKEG